MRMKPQAGTSRPRVLLPRVMINMAITADGKIATANHAVSSFGSPRDHAELLRLRTRADAVMAGARTVDLNPVNLGSGGERYRRARRRAGRTDEPLRIVVSRSGTLDPEAEIFRHRFSPIIVLTTRRAGPQNLRRLRSVADEVRCFGDKEIDFPRALAWLRKAYHVRHLLCEGGGQLNDALFRAGLVAELHLTICPFIFGGRHAPTLADGLGVSRLAQARLFRLASRRRVGAEVYLVYLKS